MKRWYVCSEEEKEENEINKRNNMYTVCIYRTKIVKSNQINDKKEFMSLT